MSVILHIIVHSFTTCSQCFQGDSASLVKIKISSNSSDMISPPPPIYTAIFGIILQWSLMYTCTQDMARKTSDSGIATTPYIYYLIHLILCSEPE